MTEQYNTELTPDEQRAFDQWVSALSAKQGRDASKDVRDYDLRGAFKAGEGPSTEEGSNSGHFTDRFKKPSHPTFSDESQYHDTDGHKGGKWLDLGKDRWEFVAGESNLKHWGEDGLRTYFANEQPVDTKLIMPGEYVDRSFRQGFDEVKAK